MTRSSLIAIGLAACLPAAITPSSAEIPVIFDTDMLGDVDDVGAVAVLHALADLGEARILGMGVSTTNPWSGRCLNALNTYFGRRGLPIGLLTEGGFSKRSRYARAIAEEFPGGDPLLPDGKAAGSAWRLYRRLLADADNRSVVIVSVGYLDNLAALLASAADETSKLNGRDLVAQKVRMWVCMGGQFPHGREACNFRRSPEAAERVLQEWPTPAIFAGGELGERIQTGRGLRRLPESSPVRRAWELYNGLENRASWDQVAVLYAVRGLDGGLDDLWGLRSGGRVVFDPHTARVSWQSIPSGAHGYLVERMPPDEVAARIERLMRHQPAKSTAVFKETVQ